MDPTTTNGGWTLLAVTDTDRLMGLLRHWYAPRLHGRVGLDTRRIVDVGAIHLRTMATLQHVLLLGCAAT